MVEDAGAAAIAVHGRTAAQSYSGMADWDLVAAIADRLAIPVFGSGDCLEPEQVIARLRSGVEGVLVGRGVLRNPWILAQAADLAAGRAPREVTLFDRGQFLLEYIALLRDERVREPEGFRHKALNPDESEPPNPESRAKSHDRWVINKVRALVLYTKGPTTDPTSNSDQQHQRPTRCTRSFQPRGPSGEPDQRKRLTFPGLTPDTYRLQPHLYFYRHNPAQLCRIVVRSTCPQRLPHRPGFQVRTTGTRDLDCKSQGRALRERGTIWANNRIMVDCKPLLLR
jgi:hypothetical protein